MKIAAALMLEDFIETLSRKTVHVRISNKLMNHADIVHQCILIFYTYIEMHFEIFLLL